MEAERESRRQRSATSPARWFLRAQGQTLGPYSAEAILAGLEAGDFLASDRVLSPGENAWTILEEHPYFASFPAIVDRPRAGELTSMPSPRQLRRKAAVAAPPAPRAPLPPLPPVKPELPAAILAPPPPPPAPEEEKTPKATLEAKPEKKGRRKKTKAPPKLPEEKPAAAIAPAAEAMAAASEPVPELASEAEADELLAAAVALERALELLPPEPARVSLHEPAPKIFVPQKPEPQAAALAPFPERPEIKPVFLAEPDRPAREPVAATRVIRLELKLPERPLRLLAILALIAGIALWAGFHFAESAKKTRGQNGFRPSDPSSPTTLPQEAGDPIPPLKAPTRPRRE